MPSSYEHLRGPWKAVIADNLGYVYPTVEDAAEALGLAAPVDVFIVRGSAAPNDRDGVTGNLLRLPASFDFRDVACEHACRFVSDNLSLLAAARYVQAQAMADGLNAAAGAYPYAGAARVES